ncbi:P2Y purinoceptor 13-like [Eucyclogobius newberryi]|uniref:P2Y purinoceptor 13-like n=1 Tax=Eucyclogobius newberryi TaxID=166745 RepID=UPI003B59E8E9
MTFYNTSTRPTPSNSSSPSPLCPKFDDATLNIALSVLFLLVFPCALVLNGIASWISLHLKSRSTFIVYVKNLVAADLLLTLTLPLKAASLEPGITVEVKAFTCCFSDVIFYCSMYTSIALMGLISLDRFFKIVQPCGKSLGKSVVFSQVSSFLVWLVLFGGTGLPTMILTNQPPPASVSEDFCMKMKSLSGLKLHGYVVTIMNAVFWFAYAVIVFCYIFITIKVLKSFRSSGSNNSQGKKKTKLRVFLILLVFFVCFVPFHVMRIPVTVNEVYGVCTQPWLDVVYTLVLWLATTNSCLDPLLYIFLCREYKNKLVDMMKARGISLGWCIEEKDNGTQ